ncbi:MAG: hypothetical protein L0H96_26040 [Humibacillus sp.]|nr:hypothetical protein [Humibacillus sp.]MDN5780336.1 hypothetical protein [Humibacillus sp.]
MSYDYTYTKRWRLDILRGEHRYVDAGPIRDHVAMLLAAGASKRAIADAAGISATAMTQLVHRGQRHTQRATAARLLAVRLEDIQRRPTGRGFVPATGTRRRIQALQAIGHAARTIGSEAGVSAAVVHNLTVQAGEWVSARNRDAILTAYDALWARPGSSKQTATMSRTKGWAPPLAWDDDTIEDPAARPNHGRPTRPGKGRPTADLVEDIEWLLEHQPCSTAQQIATRLQLSRSAIQVALSPARGNRPDLLARLTRNAQPAQEDAAA